MSNELIKAIKDIAEADPLARKIVNRSFSGFESLSSAEETDSEEIDALIKRLVETIEYQERLIDRMSQRFSIANDPEGVEKFKAAISDTPIPILRNLYNRTVLSQYSKETRYLMVVVLLDLAKESNKLPLELWETVFANNGDFGDE